MLDYNIVYRKLSSSLHWFNTSTFMIFSGKMYVKAKFNTSCASCGDQIKPGKEIAKDQTGKWVHKYCVTETNELP